MFLPEQYGALCQGKKIYAQLPGQLHAAACSLDIKKRDLAPNINFFMNVPITPEGGYKFDDGVSAPGKYVEMKALTDVMVLISNCPQLNNPCNAYNPTPVRLLIWD